VIAHSRVPSVGPQKCIVAKGGWIRMPFGVVGGVGLGMGVLNFGGDRRRRRGSLGVICGITL